MVVLGLQMRATLPLCAGADLDKPSPPKRSISQPIGSGTLVFPEPLDHGKGGLDLSSHWLLPFDAGLNHVTCHQF